MTILLATNHLRNLEGSEMWTFTIWKELIKRGYDVDVFTRVHGKLSKSMSSIRKSQLKDNYDLILVNHNIVLKKLKKINGFKILTCHGLFSKLEQSIKGADVYVAISEEIKLLLEKQGFNSHLIRNAIDLDRFSIKKPLNKKAKNVLCLCKGDKAQHLVQQACFTLDLNYKHCFGVEKIEEEMNNADIVVSLGRGAMEGLACGREIIVYDSRDYMAECGEGIITKDNFDKIKTCNFSGRRFKHEFTTDSILFELNKYNYKNQNLNRMFAINNFNVKDIVDQYIKIYENK